MYDGSPWEFARVRVVGAGHCGWWPVEFGVVDAVVGGSGGYIGVGIRVPAR